MPQVGSNTVSTEDISNRSFNLKAWLLNTDCITYSWVCLSFDNRSSWLG